jgi:2-keto-4-pentenoate hydratase
MSRSAVLVAILAFPWVFAPSPPAQAACPSDATMAAFAQNVLANRPNAPIEGMTSLEDGFCAQRKLVDLLGAHWGRPVGYKVALTAAPAQRMFGIDHPVRGVIFEGTVRNRSGAELPAAFGAAPTIEADFILRVRDAAINEAGRDHMAILRALDLAIPYIELPDTFIQGRLDAPNLLAMNVAARLGVLGEPIAVEATQDFADRLANMTVTLADDTGRELARAPGRAVLGHPLNVVAHLVEDLAREGRRLAPGDLLSVAGYSPPLPVAAGRLYTLRYEGLVAGAPAIVTVRLK